MELASQRLLTILHLAIFNREAWINGVSYNQFGVDSIHLCHIHFSHSTLRLFSFLVHYIIINHHNNNRLFEHMRNNSWPRGEESNCKSKFGNSPHLWLPFRQDRGGTCPLLLRLWLFHVWNGCDEQIEHFLFRIACLLPSSTSYSIRYWYLCGIWEEASYKVLLQPLGNEKNI